MKKWLLCTLSALIVIAMLLGLFASCNSGHNEESSTSHGEQTTDETLSQNDTETTEAVTTESDATESDTTESDTTESDTTESDTTESDATESDTTESDTTESDATESDATESDATESDTTETESTESEPPCDHSEWKYIQNITTHTKSNCNLCGQPVSNEEAVTADHTWGTSKYDKAAGGYVNSCSVCNYTVVQEGASELNLFFDPWTIMNGAKNVYSRTVLSSEEGEPVFARLYGNNNQPYFKLIDNKAGINPNTKTSGHYFIFKYRIPQNGIDQGTMSFFISSVESPIAGDGTNGVHISVSEDNEWHILVIDLTATGNSEGFPKDVLSLFRVDLFYGKNVSTTQYIDVAYAGFGDSLEELRAFDSDFEMLGYSGSSELKALFGDAAAEKVDTDNKNMEYITLTGTNQNYQIILDNGNIHPSTGNYIGLLYRNAMENTSCKIYYSSAKDWNTDLSQNYDSSEGWHFMLFDFSEVEGYKDSIARAIRIDPFSSDASSSIDLAFIEAFATKQDAIDYYVSYVQTYLDENNCDHLKTAWVYGNDGNNKTESALDFLNCFHCGQTAIEVRPAAFYISLEKITDDNGTYPAGISSSVGDSTSQTIVFNSSNFSTLYPKDGIFVEENGSLSISGFIAINGEVSSINYRVISNGTVIKKWSVCDGYIRNADIGSIDLGFNTVGTRFAAYADLNGITGTGLTIEFAVVPADIPKGLQDKYISILKIENVNVTETVKKSDFVLNESDIDPLMKNVFTGTNIVNETVMFLDYGDSKTLLYKADKIISVKSYDGSITYTKGVDYDLVDGKIVILQGSSIPCITSSVYYEGPAGPNDLLYTTINGVKTRMYWADGYNMVKWQVNVEYEHSDSWEGYKQTDNSDIYADFIEKLINGEDVTIIFYGDSITAGSNSSFYDGYAPKQFGYSLLFTQALADLFGYTVEYVDTSSLHSLIKSPPSTYVAGTRGTITYINTAVGGWGSGDGAENCKKHVLNYVSAYGCDLLIVAFGMNNMATSVNSVITSFEHIVDEVSSMEPDVNVVMISTMLPNNTAEGRLLNQVYHEAKLLASAKSYQKNGVACAVTCMTSMSDSVLDYKDFMDYSGNNVNHPNDFFYRIYAQTLLQSVIGYDNIK